MTGTSVREEALRAAVSALREPILLTSSAGEVRWVNDAAVDLLRSPAARLLGVKMTRLVSEADAVAAFLRAASRTTSPVFGSFTMDAAGNPTACRVEASVVWPHQVEDPRLLLVRLIPKAAAISRFMALNLERDELTRELARRKDMERALREGERRFRMMADEMPQLAWMARPDGYIYWYNRRWYEYTGTTPEQMEGWGWQQVHDPQVLPAVLDGWKGSIRSRTPFEMVFPLRGADGRFRPFLTRVAPLQDENGEVLHWFGTNTDVSAQQEAEERLRRADRRKDEFLATLAHELRNPLAPIRNAVTLMRMAGRLPEAAGTALDIVERQVEHLKRLVDDLLDVSRITMDKMNLRKERISLVDSIKEAIDAIRPMAQAANLRLHVRLPDEPLSLEADATRMTQVLVNLLHNAVKFTPPGGHVWLDAQRHGNDAVVSVRDTGVGIAEEHVQGVFEMFSQPNPALERPEGGLGIGLALVRRLVELHGGTVHADSPGLGKGSEFTVRVPLSHLPADLKAPSIAAGKAGTVRRRVLVVDDNMDSAVTLRKLLELHGHEVREAHDGIEGIHAAAEFKPELVLLDIGMPRMNGYEAAREMRKQATGRRMRIVALTGWGQESDKQRARDAGFDDHLTKPVDLVALQELLRR